MEAPDFWTDAQVSTAKMKELKSMKDDVAVIDKLEDLYSEIEDYIELGNEEEDQEIVDTVALLIEEFENGTKLIFGIFIFFFLISALLFLSLLNSLFLYDLLFVLMKFPNFYYILFFL